VIKKSELEMEKAKALKTARALIRLKHSLAADEELNDTLPDLALEFDKALQQGELLTLPLPEVPNASTE
jgi:hypothetical protein